MLTFSLVSKLYSWIVSSQKGAKKIHAKKMGREDFIDST